MEGRQYAGDGADWTKLIKTLLSLSIVSVTTLKTFFFLARMQSPVLMLFVCSFLLTCTDYLLIVFPRLLTVIFRSKQTLIVGQANQILHH